MGVIDLGLINYSQAALYVSQIHHHLHPLLLTCMLNDIIIKV